MYSLSLSLSPPHTFSLSIYLSIHLWLILFLAAFLSLSLTPTFSTHKIFLTNLSLTNITFLRLKPTQTFYHTLSIFYSLVTSLSLTHTFSLSLSLNFFHTQNLSHSLFYPSFSLIHFVFPSISHSLSFKDKIFLTHVPALSLSLSLSFFHTQNIAYPLCLSLSITNTIYVIFLFTFPLILLFYLLSLPAFLSVSVSPTFCLISFPHNPDHSKCCTPA